MSDVDTFTWLHISDLHCKAGDAYAQNVVLRALVNSLRERPRDWPAPDVIFVTGDLADSGHPEQYQEVGRFLDDVLDVCELSKDRLFVVPGNHDVDRTHASELIRTLSSEEESVAYFGPDSRKYHFEKLQAYGRWHREYFGDENSWLDDRTVQRPTVVDVRDIQIGVLRINSALFSAGDDDHGKLWIGRRSVDQALNEADGLQGTLWIGLIHHPLGWLHSVERGNIKGMLLQHLDCLLHGHLHETDIDALGGVRGNVVVLAAGATYQTRDYPNCALLTTIDVEQSVASVLPLRYHDSPGEVWTIDTSIYPHADGYRREYELQRLLASTEAEQPINEARQLVPWPVIFDIGRVVRPQQFVSRHNELKNAQEILAARQSFQIVGRKRVGKTSFGKKLLSTIENSDDPRFTDRRIIPAYFNLERLVKHNISAFLEHTLIAMLTATRSRVFDPEFGHLSSMAVEAELASDTSFQELTGLMQEIDERSIYGEKPKQIQPHEFEQYTRQLVSIVRKKGFDALLVFFDEANQLPDQWSADLLDSNADIFESPGLISIYATSPELSDSVDALQETFGQSIELGAFDSEADVVELLARYVKRQDETMTEAARHAVWEYSGGMPYEIQLMLQNSFRYAWQAKGQIVDVPHVEQAHEYLCHKKKDYFPIGADITHSPASRK